MSWILLTLSAEHCSPGLTQVYARAQRSCQGNSHREGKPHWHWQACLLSLPRGTAEKPGVHGSPVLPKLPATSSVLHLGHFAGPSLPKAAGTEGSWDGPRSSCPAATSPNPLSSFTSSDFLRGPVAQVFGQHFAHVAVLWKQLDHLQASGSCWKGSTEQQDKEQQQMSGHTRFTHGA